MLKVTGAFAVVVLILCFFAIGSYASAPTASAVTTTPMLLGGRFLGPVTHLVDSLSQEVQTLEQSVSGFGQSFTSQQITMQELYVIYALVS